MGRYAPTEPERAARKRQRLRDAGMVNIEVWITSQRRDELKREAAARGITLKELAAEKLA